MTEHTSFPRTRAEAIAAGAKYYATGKPCPKGHVAPRFTSNHGCSECLRESSKTYYERNADDIKAGYREYARRDPEGNRRRSNEWTAANPDKAAVIAINAKAQSRGATDRITVEEWVSLCERHGGRCVCCGNTGKVGADHVVPISQGGRNVIANIQPMCFPCNQAKWQRTTDYRDGAA